MQIEQEHLVLGCINDLSKGEEHWVGTAVASFKTLVVESLIRAMELLVDGPYSLTESTDGCRIVQQQQQQGQSSVLKSEDKGSSNNGNSAGSSFAAPPQSG